MRLLPLLLTLIMGWILFRIIRVFVRMGGSSRRQDRAGADRDPSSGPPSSVPRRTIMDAEFEDLTPPGKSAEEEPEKPRA